MCISIYHPTEEIDVNVILTFPVFDFKVEDGQYVEPPQRHLPWERHCFDGFQCDMIRHEDERSYEEKKSMFGDKKENGRYFAVVGLISTFASVGLFGVIQCDTLHFF